MVAFGVAIHVATDNTKEVEKVSAYSTTSLPTTIDLNDTSASNIRSYYSNLNNLSTNERRGTNLLKNLKPILKSGQQYLSYDGGSAIWDVYCIVDRDWTKSPASALPAAAGTYNSSTNKITGYKWGENASTYENPYLHALYYNRDQTPVARAYGDHGNNTNTGINREHIWPKGAGFDTSGQGGARGDIMHLWAAHGHTNNKHSNYYYGYVDKSKTYKDEATDFSICAGNLLGYSKSLGGSTNVFEPQDSDKGDIARACFYMVARYNYLSGSDSDGINTNNPNLELVNNITSFSSSGYTSSTSTTGKLGIIQDLLEWNRLDPPDEFEIHRNNLCYNNFTKNRNPFIDFPEWAEFIWGKSENGSYSSTSTGYATPSTDEINDFSGSTPVEEKTLSSITLNTTNVQTEFTVGDTFNYTGLVVTANYSDSTSATVTPTSVSSPDMSSAGNKTITVSYTEGGVTKNSTYQITVNSSGGGGGGGSESVTASVSIASYASSHNWVNATKYTSVDLDGVVTASVSEGSTNTGKYYTSGNEWRFYQGENAAIAISVASGYELDSVTFTYNIANTGILKDSSSNTVASGTAKAVSGSSVTFTVGNTGSATNGQVKFTNISVTYHSTSVAPAPTLTSITLDTSSVQKEFTVGDTFNYTGLVVTAHYSDNSSEVVTPTSVSSPNMSTAGQKTVVVTYETESETYEITVNNPAATSITATVSKTYYVGETITKSDIYVEDNLGNEIDDFSFVNNNYQFTYADAASGGELTNKTFTNAITGNDMTCSLTVQVRRKQAENPTLISDVLNVSYTGRSGTTYGTWESKAAPTTSAYYAGHSAAGNSSIQLRSTKTDNTYNAGVVSTASGGVISSVVISWNSNTGDGRTLNVYGKNTAYSTPNDLYSDSTKGTLLGTVVKGTSTTVNVTGSYTFIGLCSANGAMYIDSITISYVGYYTAENLANYIMIADTNGQCQDVGNVKGKFSIAKGYFEGTTKAERKTFMESNDYVIATARTRLVAWATYLNKTITAVDGDYVISANTSSFFVIAKDESDMIMVVVVVMFSVSLLFSTGLLLKRKRFR